MYKVTLFDRNCPSCCSWTAEFYCDNIDDFERKWLAQGADEETVQRFRRSKNGECVTDYYSDDPALDIVQYDENAEIYREFTYTESNPEITLYNSYRCDAVYYADKMEIKIRAAKFNGKYMLQAKYALEGMCMKNWIGDGQYCDVSCWGNPVLEHSKSFSGRSDDRADFKDDRIESFVYFALKKFETKEDLDAAYEAVKSEGPTAEDLAYLLIDIPGEAG